MTTKQETRAEASERICLELGFMGFQDRRITADFLPFLESIINAEREIAKLETEQLRYEQEAVKLESQVRDLTGERERERQALGNLLAVIHRDGGHYQAEHGSKKAAEDAETLVCWLRDNVERLERLMASRIGARIDKK